MGKQGSSAGVEVTVPCALRMYLHPVTGFCALAAPKRLAPRGGLGEWATAHQLVCVQWRAWGVRALKGGRRSH